MSRIDDVRSASVQRSIEAAQRFDRRRPEREAARVRAARQGPAGADTEERARKFRELNFGRRPIISETLDPAERIIGPTLDFDHRAPDSLGARAGMPVARIVDLEGAGYEPRGFGTGFLITPTLLLTNHHVLPEEGKTSGVAAQFGYEHDGRGLLEGEIFDLDPARFFYAHQPLDLSLVAVSPRGGNGGDLSRYGHAKLNPALGKILIGQPINIIQHPEGGLKTWAAKNNKLLDLLDNFMHYETDTLPGSSGSPVFNAFWEVVGLHHSGVPEMREGKIVNRYGGVWDDSQPDSDINWIANEGVRTSVLVRHFRDLRLGDPTRQRLLQEIFDAPSQEAAAPSGDMARGTMGGAAMRTGGAGVLATINIHGNPTITISGPPAQTSTAPPSASEAAAPERRPRFDPDYGRRRGYQDDFLTGHEVPPPSTAEARKLEMVRDRHGNETILDYHHFSLAMNAVWRIQMWSAVNVDFRSAVRSRNRSSNSTDWIADPRIPASLQLADDEMYGPARKFDRGHIVRRDDNEWGTTEDEIHYSNSDTFHWTNCTPQHEGFNQSVKQGVWGQLENHITSQSSAIGGKATIFAGPVLVAGRETSVRHNWGGGFVEIPLQFWKIVVVSERGDPTPVLRSFGFVLTQQPAITKNGLEMIERFDPGKFRQDQRSVSSIARIAGVMFPKIVVDGDAMAKTGGEVRRIKSLGDVVL